MGNVTTTCREIGGRLVGVGMAGLLEASTFLDPTEAVDFVANVLEASTEYSIIGKDLQGKILLWNEGARRIDGYDAAEVVAS